MGNISYHERERHKLTLLYQLINGTSPIHMTAILPDNIEGQSSYSLRNPQLESMLCHTNIHVLFNSFLPSCIRLWNKLDPAIKQCASLGHSKHV